MNGRGNPRSGGPLACRGGRRPAARNKPGVQTEGRNPASVLFFRRAGCPAPRQAGGPPPPPLRSGLPDERLARNVVDVTDMRPSFVDSQPNSLISGFHFRGKLPHLKNEGSTYFVTFRLADSLPAREVARLKHERSAVIEHAHAAKRPLTWHEEEQLLAWYCDKVEGLLDAGHGACWLSNGQVAKLVANALTFFLGRRYELRAWVIMPNHVHAVVWPMPGYSLSQILHSWKSFTSKEANKCLHREGQPFWQKESFDHWIRDDDERARLVAYVEQPAQSRILQTRPRLGMEQRP
jgi:REP-associated tyrosine transposase